MTNFKIIPYSSEHFHRKFDYPTHTKVQKYQKQVNSRGSQLLKYNELCTLFHTKCISCQYVISFFLEKNAKSFNQNQSRFLAKIFLKKHFMHCNQGKYIHFLFKHNVIPLEIENTSQKFMYLPQNAKISKNRVLGKFTLF